MQEYLYMCRGCWQPRYFPMGIHWWVSLHGPDCEQAIGTPLTLGEPMTTAFSRDNSLSLEDILSKPSEK